MHRSFFVSLSTLLFASYGYLMNVLGHISFSKVLFSGYYWSSSQVTNCRLVNISHVAGASHSDCLFPRRMCDETLPREVNTICSNNQINSCNLNDGSGFDFQFVQLNTLKL